MYGKYLAPRLFVSKLWFDFYILGDRFVDFGMKRDINICLQYSQLLLFLYSIFFCAVPDNYHTL